MAKPALLFDIGNVLLTFDFEPAWKHFSENSKLELSELKQRIQPLKDLLESGQKSSDDFVQEAMEAIAYTGSAREFVHHWGDIFTLNAPMVRFLEIHHHDFELYLFSNTSGLHKDFMYENFDIFHHFKGGIFSHEAQAMKPENRMYELAVSELGLDPSLTLYIDDLEENVQTGIKHGFHTHQYDFRHHESFVEAFITWRQLVER